MHYIKNQSLSRRTFLKGAGVCLSLPFLEAMTPLRVRGAATSPAPARMACLYVPNGVNIMKWLPPDAGRAYALSPTLSVLEPWRDEFNILSGLGHPHSKGGHSGADTWLTGADLSGTPGYDYRNSISVDQMAAEVVGLRTRLPSLELSSTGGTGKPGHSQTLSFTRDAVPLPAEQNPRNVFERLFVDETGDTRQARLQRFAEDKSILDAVMDQTHALERRLGRADQGKLDEYLTSVREVERRVKRAESWMDVPKAKIEAEALKLNARPNDNDDRGTYLRTMYDLMVLAFQTDTTRVATFQIGREAAGGYYNELGLKANHHELSHHGGDGDMLEGLHKIDRFQLEQLGYFLSRLREARDAQGPLLDRTMVLYGSGMNSGEGGGHSPKNLPLVFAGGRALGIRLGSHMRFEEDSTPLSNVMLTMLHKMDVPAERFMDSTGTLNGLA